MTITDNDDPPTVQFSAAASSGAESTTSAVIDVSLSAPSARTVTVKYATANGTAVSGSDYAARAGVLTFAPGVTSLKIAVPIVNDTKVEPPPAESFTVTLSAPVNATLLGGTQVHTYTINDDDRVRIDQARLDRVFGGRSRSGDKGHDYCPEGRRRQR